MIDPNEIARSTCGPLFGPDGFEVVHLLYGPKDGSCASFHNIPEGYDDRKTQCPHCRRRIFTWHLAR